MFPLLGWTPSLAANPPPRLPVAHPAPLNPTAAAGGPAPHTPADPGPPPPREERGSFGDRGRPGFGDRGRGGFGDRGRDRGPRRDDRGDRGFRRDERSAPEQAPSDARVQEPVRESADVVPGPAPDRGFVAERPPRREGRPERGPP